MNYPEKQIVADISAGPWTISFQESRRGPVDPITVDSLFDWTTSSDPNIAAYSGKAVYTTDFNLTQIPQGEVYIDLGKVMVMAKVKVNGEYAGGVWTDPYRVNITPYLKEGNNTVEIDVVSTWRNRLIADASLAPEERVTHANFEILGANEVPQTSGLLGPVTIYTIK